MASRSHSSHFLFPSQLSRFTLALVTTGKFLSALLRGEPVLKEIVAAPVLVNPKLGLAWGLEKNNGNIFLWHWSNNPGYRAFVMFTSSDHGAHAG